MLKVYYMKFITSVKPNEKKMNLYNLGKLQCNSGKAN